jgi:predicted DNA-binding protein YlxM (UPF0122 family)
MTKYLNRPFVDMDEVIDRTTRATRFRRSAVFSHRRQQQLCNLRFAMWWVIYSHGGYSHEEIGEKFQRDRQAIRNGLMRAQQLLETCEGFRDLVDEIKKPFLQ